MILETDTVMIDIDKVSFVHKDHNMVIAGGGVVNLTSEDTEDLIHALRWLHKSHMYDDKLKKIRWVKGES